MKYKPLIVLLFMAVMIVSVSARASDRLRYNPFEQPDMTSDALRISTNKASRNEIKLRGTVIDGNDSLANINGEFYRLNQEVSGYRVVQIKRASVKLLRAGNEMVLKLNDEN